jgi:fructokinase
VKSMMPRVPYATGTVQVTLDAQGIPAYDIKENVAWDNIPFTEEIEDIAKNCYAVCWGTLAQRNIVSRTTIHKFLDTMGKMPKPLKIFDVNLRQNFYSKEIIEESLKCCNILKINDEELIILAAMFNYPVFDSKETCLRILKDYSLDVLVLTCGAHGSYVFTPDTVSFRDTPHVEVIDTVGAGDSFTGSFCVGLLCGMKIEDAHKMAVEVSAYVCTQKGAMPELPERLLI